MAWWVYENLLVAMYLQMHWLITSSGELLAACCEYYSHIIALSRPYPEGRKRRRDKRISDDACRQACHRTKKKDSPFP